MKRSRCAFSRVVRGLGSNTTTDDRVENRDSPARGRAQEGASSAIPAVAVVAALCGYHGGGRTFLTI